MALSQDLINQFTKLTSREKENKEVIVNGTYKTINGEEYVKLDGSDIWTPVVSMVEAEDGERVSVLIKNHTATVTGNITSPAARNKSVQNLKEEVDEFGNTIQQMDNTITQQGNSITQIDNNIQQIDNNIQQIDNVISQHDNVIQQIDNTIRQQGNNITQMNNTISQQGNQINQMNDTIESHGNTINQQNNTIQQQGNIIQQQGNLISQQGNAITQQNNVINQQGNIIEQHNTTLQTVDSNIQILNSAFKIEDGVLTGLDEIIVGELETNHLDAKYANISFSNINMAAVRKIFSDSGIIKDLVVQSGHITGELIGVTLKGDLIEGNTIKADKLVVKGSDGLYYKLNIDGLDNISTQNASKFTLTTSKPTDWDNNYTDYYVINNNKYIHVSGNTAPTWAANIYYKLNTDHQNGLDGSVIIAHSITADRVQVSDLVAFDATIGGFNITDHSLYSGVKSSATNTTRGVFMNDSGEFAIGDSNNFMRYFLDSNTNTYKLEISAGIIKMGGSNKTVQETINEINSNLNNLEFTNNNLLFNCQKMKPDSSQWRGNVSINYSDLPNSDNIDFKVSGTASTKYFVPYNKNNIYKLETWIKAVTNFSNTLYPHIKMYDMDKKEIALEYMNTLNESDTVLTEDLKNGDTIIHADNLSGWITLKNDWHVYIGIYDYVMKNGYKYDNYTQHIIQFANYNEDKTQYINKSNNTISLKKPYTRCNSSSRN